MATIEYRGQNKRTGEHSYRVTVSGGYDQDKQNRIRRTFKYPTTMREATRKAAVVKDAASLELNFEMGNVSSGKDYKLAEYAKYFLDHHCRPGLSPSTVVWYEDIINNRIIPQLGNRRLSQIRPIDINKFLQHLTTSARSTKKDQPISASYIRGIFRCLSSMFTQAVYWQFMASNPCDKVRPPHVPHNEMQFLNDEQTMVLIDHLKGEPIKYQAIAYIAIFGGLRRGEIVGLYWTDIDFDNRTVSIKRTRKHIKNLGCIDKETKTPGSVRKITLPDIVFNRLAILKLEQNNQKAKLKNQWIESDHVFKQWNGGPMSDDAPYHWLVKLIEKIRQEQQVSAGKQGKTLETNDLFPAIRFHDLRHTSATLMIASGVDIRTVSKRLGHAQTSTTLNTYAHSIDARDKGASDTLGELLLKKTPNPK